MDISITDFVEADWSEEQHQVRVEDLPVNIATGLLNVYSLQPMTIAYHEEASFARPQGNMVFDIETGSMPREDLELVVPSFGDCPPFDPSEVRLGNLKQKHLIEEKLEKARDNHVRDWKRKKEEHEQKFYGKAALSPYTGRVLSIGYMFEEEPSVCVVHACENEEDLLRNFWTTASRYDNNIGHNIFEFDLPYLRTRSIKLGVEVPNWALERGRFWSGAFFDTMSFMSPGRSYITQNRLAIYLGVGYPRSESGADFENKWHADREAAVQYLCDDLCELFAIWQHLKP